jgi:hypothetical protein
MVFPTVIEEVDSAIDGFMNNADRGLLVFRSAQMMTTEGQRRDFDIGMAAEGPHGDSTGLIYAWHDDS